MKIHLYGEEEDRPLRRRNRLIPDPLPKIGQHLLVCAPTGSGKSQLITNLLTRPYRGVFDKIWFYHPQWDDDMYRRVVGVPPEQVIREYSDESLDAIMDDVKRDRDLQKPRFDLIVLDDSMETWRTSRKLNDFLTWCRHKGITVWASIQYLHGCMSKLARQQFTSIIAFASSKEADIKLLSELSPAGTRPFYDALEQVRAANRRDGHTYHTLHLNSRHPQTFFQDLNEPITPHGFEPQGSSQASGSQDPPAEVGEDADC